jgi:hypothetical protein
VDALIPRRGIGRFGHRAGWFHRSRIRPTRPAGLTRHHPRSGELLPLGQGMFAARLAICDMGLPRVRRSGASVRLLAKTR